MTNPSSPIEQIKDALDYADPNRPRDFWRKQRALARISAIVVESLGEDDKLLDTDFTDEGYFKAGRNTLRAQLRQQWSNQGEK